ncbi:MAG TPA: DUF5689 domain-containing protein [Lacibacter sp.]|nr:DUF5689 domain-containing protein [Lacibacter sp.]
MLSSTLNLIIKNVIPCFLLALVFTSCEKEETLQPQPGNPTQPVTIKSQFTGSEFTLSENAGETAYELQLSSITTRQESIILSITSATAQYGTDFSTLPAAENGKIQVTVEAGKQTVQFKIIPVNNNIRNGNRELQFTITSEGSIKPDVRSNAKIILADEDQKASVSFALANASIMESHAEGYVAQLHITPFAFSDGFVEVGFTSANAVYGAQFITEPAMVNGKLRIPVLQNQSTISFQIKPVNDAVQAPLRTINFGISHVSDNLEQSMQNQLAFTIADDDHPLPPATPVQTIRNMYKGTDLYFWTETFISGVVTSINDNIQPAVAYIEDASGGIAVRFTSNNTLTYGERVIINLQGTYITKTNDALEIKDVPNNAVIKTGWEIHVIPTITLTELYSANTSMEGKLVSLSNINFTQADGTTTLQGDRIVTDGQRTVIVRTESFASFRNRIIPQGKVTVIGILVEKNGQYIILPLNRESIY